MGDLQFETRQLAEAERRLAGEAEKTAPGSAGDEARRRLAAEQERLAERAESGARRRRASWATRRARAASRRDADARKAASQAAQDIDRERIAERMRASAEAMRQASAPLARRAKSPASWRGPWIASPVSWEQAAGTADRETEKLSDQLARAGELRDQLSEFAADHRALEREAARASKAAAPQSDAEGQRPQQGQSQGAPGVARAHRENQTARAAAARTD